MRNKLFLTAATLMALLFFSFVVQAQELIGFWGVKEVKVGDEIMTPVAKWFKINKDGTIQSGNGWLQNSAGTWTYNKKSRQFTPKETQGTGVEDGAGAFTVSFKEEEMTWEREEEGTQVVVSLYKITQLPMGPADQLAGLWDLIKATKEGQETTSSFDPDNRHYLLIRSDRVFRERTAQNKLEYGLWHINGHRPEITFIRNDKTKEDEKWRISFQGSALTMVGISDANKGVEMVYSRIHQFPE